ncbi:hypothetical protein [Phormidium sp. CCY1219]|uniref:hypothetical protein n=1 Tax=Phormidium sp. CCY1219 TaxID=2886104 RepID=UPI002D1F0FA9|nr:hypothetical protein [Phormidium sp. CCY1219]MEB3826819.1 hypothetical protein [Phormidium sp. CCY1219]
MLVPPGRSAIASLHRLARCCGQHWRDRKASFNVFLTVFSPKSDRLTRVIPTDLAEAGTKEPHREKVPPLHVGSRVGKTDEGDRCHPPTQREKIREFKPRFIHVNRGTFASVG